MGGDCDNHVNYGLLEFRLARRLGAGHVTASLVIDLPMKKAANCMSLAAFVMRYGGLGTIERWLESLINTRFISLNVISYPYLYPALALTNSKH